MRNFERTLRYDSFFIEHGDRDIGNVLEVMSVSSIIRLETKRDELIVFTSTTRDIM